MKILGFPLKTWDLGNPLPSHYIQGKAEMRKEGCGAQSKVYKQEWETLTTKNNPGTRETNIYLKGNNARVN